MLKIFFYIKSVKVKSNGEAPIYAKIQFGNQIISMNIRKFVSLERWTFTNKVRNFLKLEQEKVLKKEFRHFSLTTNKLFKELRKWESTLICYFYFEITSSIISIFCNGRIKLYRINSCKFLNVIAQCIYLNLSHLI